MKAGILAGLLVLSAAAVGRSASAAPTLLAPGVVSTGDSESHPTLSPDGATLYFVKLWPDFSHWTIVETHRVANGWGEVAVAPFSGRYDDADLSFSPDGGTIFFISNRPDREGDPARPDTDLFRMKKTQGSWSAPERIVELASPGNEWFPNQAADGTLFFGSERREGNLGPEGTSDLWRAKWTGERFGAPENLGPVVNSAKQEIEPWISADGKTMVFSARGRADSQGQYDFYVSYFCDNAWSEPKPLTGGANSAGWEFGGRFTPDGKKFLFASTRAREWPPEKVESGLAGAAGYRTLLDRLHAPGNGLFDVYEVEAGELGITSPCAPAVSE